MVKQNFAKSGPPLGSPPESSPDHQCQRRPFLLSSSLLLGFGWQGGEVSSRGVGMVLEGFTCSKVPTLRRKQVWLIASRDAYLVQPPQCLLRCLRSIYASEQMSPW
jgi:hypothetical protein